MIYLNALMLGLENLNLLNMSWQVSGQDGLIQSTVSFTLYMTI